MRLLLLLVFLGASMLARADGCYFAKVNITPSIPYQRATVAFRNGEETMVIENTINSPEADVSWVVPIPAKPTMVEPAYEDFYRRANSQYRPNLMSGPFSKDWGFFVLGISPFLIVALSAPFRLRREKGGVKQLVRETFVATVISILFLFLFFPVFATSGVRSSSNGVDTIIAKQVGDYDVEVLQAVGAQPLMDWLQKHGTPLPDKAKPIIDDYVREGWVFMVAKLRVSPGEKLRAHPIVVKFPAKEPIYPMRLTGLVPEPLVLELFVIADGTAKVAGLEAWASRKSNETKKDEEKKIDEYWEMRQLEWEGAAVTRLRTRLQPSDMKRDYRIAIGPYEEYRRDVWVEAQAKQDATQRGMLIAALVSVVMAFWGLARRWPSSQWFVATLATMTIAGCLGAWLFLSSITIVY